MAPGPGAFNASTSFGNSLLSCTVVIGARNAAAQAAMSGLTSVVPETRPGCAFS